MAKQRRKSAGCDPRLGAGGVTEVQIAFLVDCYLRDRGYARTMREFRIEASPVLSPCKADAPLKMMSLGDILNDYVALKEQVLAVQSEKAKMESFVASVKDMVSSYESCGVRSLPLGPLPSTPAAPITQVVKRKTSPRGHESPMLDITNTAIGTKRIRHCPPVLPGRDAKAATPFTPARQPSIDPQTPQQPGVVSGSGGFPTEFRTPKAATLPQSYEPSKARSKRQQVKPTTSKCKSLDFTSSSEPLCHPAPPTRIKSNENENEKLPEKQEASGIPVDVFCEELFTTEPLSSIDDILGTSLDGTSFSELMNSMLAEDMIQEISSPSSTRGLDSEQALSESDSGFMADVICVDGDEVRKSKISARTIHGNDENTPPSSRH